MPSCTHYQLSVWLKKGRSDYLLPMVLVYTTCKNTEEAVKLGNILLHQKLAAAVNIWPIQSMYMEADMLQNHLGAALLIKTVENKLQAIEDLIAAHHTHAVPYMGALEVRRFNRAYREWMQMVMQ